MRAGKEYLSLSLDLVWDVEMDIMENISNTGTDREWSFIMEYQEVIIITDGGSHFARAP